MMLETQAITEQAAALHSRMFKWLAQTSSANPTARSTIASASSLIGDPTVLAHLHPPFTSPSEWGQAVQRCITAHMTTRPTIPLDQASFHLYPHDCGFNDSSDPIGALLDAHEYCRRSNFTSVNEEALSIASHVNWDAQQFTYTPAPSIFLARFYLHIIYHSTPDSPCPVKQLLGCIDPNVVWHSPSVFRAPSFLSLTPEAARRLKKWLPTPRDVDDYTTSQLSLLLRVSILLHQCGQEMDDAFADARSLTFWLRMFEQHRDLFSYQIIVDVTSLVSAYLYSAVLFSGSQKQIGRASCRERVSQLV